MLSHLIVGGKPRAAHRPYYGDSRQFYTCKKLLVMKNGMAFLTVNCQRDGTGQKRVQMAVYGRLPSVAEERDLCYRVKRATASRSGTSQNPQTPTPNQHQSQKHKSHVL